MERRKFTREFKLEAVRLIRERGVSYIQAFTQPKRELAVLLPEWLRFVATLSRRALECDAVNYNEP
jgi:hypothetical protein